MKLRADITGICIIFCLQLGQAEAPRTDLCDFAEKIIEGPHKDAFRPSRKDSQGSKNLQAAVQDRYDHCQAEKAKAEGLR